MEEQVTGYRVQGTGETPDTRHAPPDTSSRPPSPSPKSEPRTLSRSQREFLGLVAAGALASEAEFGIPAAVTIAQAILESAAKVDGVWTWGGSLLFREANNPFGIKHVHHRGEEPYEEFSAETYELKYGKLEEQRALFQRFPDLASAFRAHALLFLTLPRYKPALWARHDWQRFAEQIMLCGYSTDRPELCKQPGCVHYAGKLIKLVDDYRLNDARALDQEKVL